MTQQPDNNKAQTRPVESLEALRRLLDGAEEIVVDQTGSIHAANDPKVVQRPQERTVLKPQRWFAPSRCCQEDAQ